MTFSRRPSRPSRPNKRTEAFHRAIAEGDPTQLPEVLEDADFAYGMATRKKPVQHEAEIQKRIVVHLRRHLPARSIVFAVPNQAYSDAHRFAAAAKGQLAGVPDLFCVVEGSWYGLEVKSDAGRVSPAQKFMHDAFSEHSVPCGVVRSVEEARRFLEVAGVVFI